MTRIKKMFENFWKVKILSDKFRFKEKKLFYEIFLDGYACALIDIKEKLK